MSVKISYATIKLNKMDSASCERRAKYTPENKRPSPSMAEQFPYP